MRCVQCNTPIADTARFCHKCGSPVIVEPPEASHTNVQIQEQEKSAASAVVAESPIEQPEQSEPATDSASEPTETPSKSENSASVESVESIPTQYELPTVLAESVASSNVVDTAAQEQETPPDVSTEETVEIGPLMRAVAEAEANANADETQDILIADLSTVQTNPLSVGIDVARPVAEATSVEPVTPATTVTRSEPERVPVRPRPAQSARSSVSIPSRPGPLPASSTSIPGRPNQGASPATGIPARPRQITGRFQQSTQSAQPEFKPSLPPSQIPASPVPPPPIAPTVPERAVASLPTMPMATMPPTPQTPTVQPLSPVPEPPALPEMPIAPTQYFQAQHFSSRTRPGVIAMQQTKRGRNRNRRGCLPGFLITLVLVVILGAAGWVYVARPYLHSQVVAQIDQAMTAEVNQLPTSLPLPGGTVRVTDAMLNNLLALSLPSNIPIQHSQAQISASGLQIVFQTEGLSSSITGVPVASQGHLLLSQVSVKGVISLILSANDISSLFNQHIAAALVRIHHTVRSVTLLNHEMDLVLA